MRMRRIRQLTYVETLTSESLLIDGRERFIGELSCRYNAHSPYLRCAVNPDGPCENCSYYEKVSEDSP